MKAVGSRPGEGKNKTGGGEGTEKEKKNGAIQGGN